MSKESDNFIAVGVDEVKCLDGPCQRRLQEEGIIKCIAVEAPTKNKDKKTDLTPENSFFLRTCLYPSPGEAKDEVEIKED